MSKKPRNLIETMAGIALCVGFIGLLALFFPMPAQITSGRTIAIQTMFVADGDVHGALGTGFIIGPHGQFITAAHVIPPTTLLAAVRFQGQPRIYYVRVLYRDSAHDVLLGKIDRETPDTFSLCGSIGKPGSAVEWVGQGLGYEWSHNRGWLMGAGRKDSLNHDNMLEISGSALPGDSGSALVDTDRGCVEGVVTERLGISAIGFAQPLEYIRGILDNYKGLDR